VRPAYAGLIAQVTAALVATVVASVAQAGISVWLPVQVGVALGISLLLRQPRWWWPIHLIFAPAVYLALQLGLPPWIYLLAFVLAWLVFGRIDQSRVPLYLSNRQALDALEALIPAGASVMDVGAGTGTVLARLGRRTDLKVVGVEHAWLPWLLGQCRLRLGHVPATLIRGEIERCSLDGYDVVYAFLSPAAMPALWQQARAEMRSGSVLVSNTFGVPGVPADRVIELNDWKGARLYLWQMP